MQVFLVPALLQMRIKNLFNIKITNSGGLVAG